MLILVYYQNYINGRLSIPFILFLPIYTHTVTEYRVLFFFFVFKGNANLELLVRNFQLIVGKHVNYFFKTK